MKNDGFCLPLLLTPAYLVLGISASRYFRMFYSLLIRNIL